MRRASSNKGKVYVEYTLTVSLMLGVAITSSTYMAGINDALFRRAEDRISQTLRNLDGAEPLSEVADANTEISPSPDENLEPSVDEAPAPEDGDNEDPAEEGDQSSEADDGLDASENSSETPEVDSDTPEHAEEDEAADKAVAAFEAGSVLILVDDRILAVGKFVEWSGTDPIGGPCYIDNGGSCRSDAAIWIGTWAMP